MSTFWIEHWICSCYGRVPTIPENVKEIGKYAFSHCSSLRSISIPNSVKKIGDYAFLNCYSLTETTIPDNVEKVGIGIFSFRENSFDYGIGYY